MARACSRGGCAPVHLQIDLSDGAGKCKGARSKPAALLTLRVSTARPPERHSSGASVRGDAQGAALLLALVALHLLGPLSSPGGDVLAAVSHGGPPGLLPQVSGVHHLRGRHHQRGLVPTGALGKLGAWELPLVLRVQRSPDHLFSPVPLLRRGTVIPLWLPGDGHLGRGVLLPAVTPVLPLPVLSPRLVAGPPGGPRRVRGGGHVCAPGAVPEVVRGGHPRRAHLAGRRRWQHGVNSWRCVTCATPLCRPGGGRPSLILLLVLAIAHELFQAQT
mmetsp:Transcript_98996/g.295711  ORF Transcript_98996/g.295711 Transcript_98996/m.295711 type:complete len:275 (-) Transcript_98996:1280-2104(-)